MIRTAAAVTACLVFSCHVHAGHVVQVDIDGAADNNITFNPNFSFGGDTTVASISSAASMAFGIAPGSHIFGGNGSLEPDTYVFSYAPDTQADNLVIPANTDLGNGMLATGEVGGGIGAYSVYATWPFTTNVSGGPVNFQVQSSVASFSVSVDQNNTGDIWVYLGDIDYAGGSITVTQASSSNTFVSMRASGILFEYVPAPGAASLLAFAGLTMTRRRR